MRKTVIKKVLFFVLPIIGVGTLSAIVPSGTVSALAGSESDLVNIALLDGLRICYAKGNDYIIGSGLQLQNFNAYTQAWGAIIGRKGDDDGTVVVPTMVGNTLSDSDLSCNYVFAGYNAGGGTITGLDARYSSSKDPTFYGYMPDGDKNAELGGDEESEQIKIKLSVSDGSGNNTAKTSSSGELICDGNFGYHDGWVNDYHYWEISKCTGEIKLTYSKNDQVYFQIAGGAPVAQYVQAGMYGQSNEADGPVSLNWITDHFNLHQTIEVSEGTSFKDAFTSSDIYDYLTEDIAQAFSGVYSNAKPTISVTTVSSSTIEEGSNVNSYYKFFNDSADIAARIAVYNLAGDSGSDYLITGSFSGASGKANTAYAWWPKPYIYHLYYQYLQDIVSSEEYNGHVAVGECGQEVPASNYYFKNSPTSWCEISIDTQGEGAKYTSLAIVGGSGSLEKGTFESALEWLKNEDNYSDFEESDYAGGTYVDGVAVGDEDNGDPDDGDPCYNNAGSLGWIACPLITTFGSLADDVYTDVEENYLKIPAWDYFGTHGEEGVGVYTAWDAFRNIANTAFVVLFLVVIFSQLTGVGIDNYGIKKILPKLIVAAILINLSYLICELAVDLSNVLGLGIEDLFENIVSFPEDTLNGYEATASQYVVTFGALGAVGLAALFISPGLILAVLLGLLSIVIAVFFLWIILITRHVGVVLLTVLSPLAFVCYILPNTNKIFGRWASMFKGLLFLYPICSLVVSGGQMAGEIIASIPTESNSMRLAAMIVQVIPYFLIPTLLRGSLSAFGSFNARLSALSRGVRGATVGRFGRSETARRATTALNNLDAGGLRAKAANTRLGRITGISRLRARQVAASERARQENLEAGRMLQANTSNRLESKHPERVSRAAMQNQLNDAIKSNDEAKYFAVLDDVVRRFGVSKAAEMDRTAITQAGESGLMAKGKRASFLRNSAERYGSFEAKDKALNRFKLSGGVNKTGNYIDLASYERDEMSVTDFSDADAATLNANSIERAIANGNVSRETAQRLMENESSRNSMDDAQQLMWAAYAQYGANISKDEAESALTTGTIQVNSQQMNVHDLIKSQPKRVIIENNTGGPSGGSGSGPTGGGPSGGPSGGPGGGPSGGPSGGPGGGPSGGSSSGSGGGPTGGGPSGGSSSGSGGGPTGGGPSGGPSGGPGGGPSGGPSGGPGGGPSGGSSSGSGGGPTGGGPSGGSGGGPSGGSSGTP